MQLNSTTNCSWINDSLTKCELKLNIVTFKKEALLEETAQLTTECIALIFFPVWINQTSEVEGEFFW